MTETKKGKLTLEQLATGQPARDYYEKLPSDGADSGPADRNLYGFTTDGSQGADMELKERQVLVHLRAVGLGSSAIDEIME